MTNEEVKVVLKSLADNPLLSAEHIIKALYKAIELVEAQPCEDCISRAETLKAIEKEKQGWEGSERYAIDECHSRIAELPSVTPKASEQQPMHGYKIDFFTPTAQAWLSSFNTDSATECFTAVQELKKRLEGDADANNN